MMAKDPVCGMEVDTNKANFQTTYQGKTYYFCSAECKRDFDKDPKKYAKEGMGEHEHGMEHGEHRH